MRMREGGSFGNARRFLRADDLETRNRRVDRNPVDDYFTFACTFCRSTQYRFILAETVLRAAADIVRV